MCGIKAGPISSRSQYSSPTPVCLGARTQIKLQAVFFPELDAFFVHLLLLVAYLYDLAAMTLQCFLRDERMVGIDGMLGVFDEGVDWDRLEQAR